MDPALALKTCRADGILVKPHTAIAATDESLLSGPAFNSSLLVAECTSEHPAGRWTYVVAMHANPGEEPISGHIRLRALFEPGDTALVQSGHQNSGPGAFVAWDWRNATATRVDLHATIPVSLDHEGWTFHVLAPILSSGLAVIGDVTKFVTAGDARIEIFETVRGVRLVVKGSGETVTITGWAAIAPSSPDGIVSHDPSTGIWTVDIGVPSRGWADLHVDA
jgi:hypothetical protein